MRELKNEDSLYIAQLDSSGRCKWSWSWLKVEVKQEVKGVVHTLLLSLYFKKTDKAGHAKCTLCTKEINCANKGVHALTSHCDTAKHRDKVVTILTSRSICTPPENAIPETQGPEALRERARGKLPVSTFQRVANAEVLYLATIYTEN